MISIEIREHMIRASVFGEFTLADFHAFEQAMTGELSFAGPPGVLFDLGDMTGFTLDVAWEEMRFSREHSTDFRRVALVGHLATMNVDAWLLRLFLDAEIEVFDSVELAEDWIRAG